MSDLDAECRAGQGDDVEDGDSLTEVGNPEGDPEREEYSMG